MTEIPEHLRKRAEARREANAAKDEPTVEVPVAELELLKEWYDRGQDTPFTSDGINVVGLFQRLVNLIPEPPYVPDEALVDRYAGVMVKWLEDARRDLIALHSAGIIVTLSDEPTS